MRGWMLAVGLFGFAGAAMAQTQAVETNFPPLRDYPAPACAKPGAAPKRPGAINAMEVDRYNVMLGTYNKKAHDYVVCINAYVRAADNDSDLIRKRSRAAVDEANAQTP